MNNQTKALLIAMRLLKQNKLEELTNLLNAYDHFYWCSDDYMIVSKGERTDDAIRRQCELNSIDYNSLMASMYLNMTENPFQKDVI